ncbi:MULTISPECIES: MFS transporter [Leptospira]|uniref:MFS transporter n=1 Tax=Leptospira TaxID=171 RepID=UPI001E441A4B|nr:MULTISPECIES: MFS transporter [Leptospira]MDL5245757.1 MFS transporter [Leptospira weilii]UPY80066.1 MFS transporter [Leptospira weilii]
MKRQPMQNIKRAPFREILGWCMFDFANSSYTTVIISVTYGIIFSQLVVPSSSNQENPFEYGNLLWSIALAISYLLVVITGPVFGAITDYSARKKQFLFYSYIFCIISTGALWFVITPGQYLLAFILIVCSNFFFASGENFASSFLPYLGPKEDLGKISGYAWGIGYFGGIAAVALVNTLGPKTMANFNSLRLVGPYTAFFFLFAGVPTFLLLREYTAGKEKPEGLSYLKIGIERVTSTMKEIHKFRDMALYLVSLFFAMAALGIVISFAFIYGAQEIKTEEKHEIAMFLLIQLFAAIGAIVFGYIQDKIGAKKTFNITLLLWIICLLLIYWVKDLTALLVEIGIPTTQQWVFVGTTVFAGTGLGATQSASRAIIGLFAPESKSGEFFGLWGLSGKIAGAFGLVAVGGLQVLFDLRNSFLVVSVFFIVSLLINFLVDEKRGIQAAIDYQET